MKDLSDLQPLVSRDGVLEIQRYTTRANATARHLSFVRKILLELGGQHAQPGTLGPATLRQEDNYYA